MMARCKSCNTRIEPDVKNCPHCGAEVPKGFFAVPWVMLLIVIFVVLEIISGRGLGQGPKSAGETPTVKEQQP